MKNGRNERIRRKTAHRKRVHGIEIIIEIMEAIFDISISSNVKS